MLPAPSTDDGADAAVGTLGRWLTDTQDVRASDDASVEEAINGTPPLPLSFPRDWPASFKTSAALKRLINKSGLQGTRVRVVMLDAAARAGLPADFGVALHGFQNATRLQALRGWSVVKGFVVAERDNAPDSFIALRHWWNQLPDGTWTDATPSWAAAETRVLLVETPLGEKHEAPLSAAELAFATSLAARLGGGKAPAAPAEEPPSPKPAPPRPQGKVQSKTDAMAAMSLADAPTSPATTTTVATATATAPAATTPLSKTARFAPWLVQLEGELYEVALEVHKRTSGEDLASDADEESEREELELIRRRDRDLGPAAAEARHLAELEAVGRRLASLVQLVHAELLPRMPSDPEALYLASCADFLARKYDSALKLLQTSLLPEQVCTKRQLAARYYYLANIAIKLATEGAEMEEGKPIVPVHEPKRLAELCDVMERGLTEAMRLDPKLASPYIDCQMLCQLRHPTDMLAQVKLHAELVSGAVSTRKFWVSALQRPMHFYPKLRSSPWWDAFDFPWALQLLASFAEIKREVMAMRNPPAEPKAAGKAAGSDRSADRWSKVGREHDAGDRVLLEDGDWSELVLLNADPKVSAAVARNRRACPQTLKLLDSIQEASDMARRGVGESTFSALGSGAHLKPHCGATNTRLTAHLPLLVPEGCSIRVGTEERTYREGELMVFDDSWEHEVRESLSAAPRPTAHPYLPPPLADPRAPRLASRSGCVALRARCASSCSSGSGTPTSTRSSTQSCSSTCRPRTRSTSATCGCRLSSAPRRKGCRSSQADGATESGSINHISKVK